MMIKKRKALLFLLPIGILSLPLLAQLQRQPSPLKAQPAPPYQPQVGPAPRFVTYHLAGVNLINQKWDKRVELDGGLCDPKNEYCLISGNGPDGCEYILELSPGFEADGQYWSNYSRDELKHLFKGFRVPLVTGRDVRIGDTPQQVQSKIGKPMTQSTYKNERLYNYEHRGKRLYNARYTFEHGKLTAIYFRDARPPNKSNAFKPSGGCL